MTGKSTLALLGAACAIGGYFVFVELGAESHDDLARASRLLVPGWKSTEVRELRISRPRDKSAKDIVLRREGTGAASGAGTWRIVEPISATANPTEVDRAVSDLLMVEKKQTLPNADRKVVGLDEPRLVVHIDRSLAKGGAAAAPSGTALEKTEGLDVSFGEEDAVTGKTVYASAGDDRTVHAVTSAVYGTLSRPLNDFRDRAIMTIDRWSISRISIAGPDGKLVSFKKDGEPWLMDAPEQDFAERSKVEELLRAVTEAKTKEFVAEPADAAALKAAGLDAPRFVVTLEAGAQKESLEVGKADAEKHELSVRRGGSQTVVTVDDALGRSLTLDPETWRSPLVLPPSGDRVEALEIRRADQAAPLARIVRNKEGEGFTFAAPRTATADAAAVEELCNALRALTVIATPAKQVEDPANFGLDDKHALLVTLETAKDRHGFRLGKASARENGWFIQREGRTSAQETVIDRASRLRSPLAALRDRTLLGRSIDEVARIDVSRKSGARAYVRLKDGGWSTHEAKADDLSLTTLAGDLAALRAERILPSQDDLKGTGLDAPWLKSIVSWRDETEPPAFVSLGKVTPESDGFHAKYTRGDDVVLFVAPRVLVDELDMEHVAAAPATGTATTSGTGSGTSGPAAPSATATTPTAGPEGPK